MFLQSTPSSAGFGTDETGENLGLSQWVTDTKEAIKDAFSIDRFVTFFSKLEDTAIKTNRTVSAGFKDYGVQMEKSMYNVFIATQSIGGEITDTSDYLSSLAATMGTLPSIQEDVITNAISFSKLSGMALKDVAQYVGEYTHIGLGQKDALDRLNKIYTNAKKFGVDANKLTKSVNENLLKSNSYGFKGGVEGLTKMAIQAQKLGMSMSSVFQIADKALDPEKAIEMAAEMQMLGGNVGALADPFRLMYLAQNDVKGLQDEFVKAAESSAIFNEQTGEFQITGEQMRRLRAQAEQLGVSYDEIAETAIRAKKEQMVMSKVPMNLKVSDETKGIISSLAEIKGGKVQIQIPGTQNMVDVANLTQNQIKEIEQMGVDAKTAETKGATDLLGTARAQLSAAEKQTVAMNQMRDAVVTMTGAFTTGKNILDYAASLAKAAGGKGNDEGVGVIQDEANKLGVLGKLDTGLANTVAGMKQYIADPMEGLRKDLNKLSQSMSGKSNTDFKIHDATFPSGGAPTVMSEGKVYKGIVGDQVIVGTELDKAFKISQEQMQKAKDIANALGTNLEYMGNPFSMMANATVQNKMGSPTSKLQEMSTTTNNNINISGGANVSGSVEVKVNGSGINMDDPKLSSLITAKVSAMIEERLSKGWNQKQGNVVS